MQNVQKLAVDNNIDVLGMVYVYITFHKKVYLNFKFNFETHIYFQIIYMYTHTHTYTIYIG